MEEFSAEYFKKLAHDIMFDLNDEEVSELQEEFKVLLQRSSCWTALIQRVLKK